MDGRTVQGAGGQFVLEQLGTYEGSGLVCQLSFLASQQGGRGRGGGISSGNWEDD